VCYGNSISGCGAGKSPGLRRTIREGELIPHIKGENSKMTTAQCPNGCKSECDTPFYYPPYACGIGKDQPELGVLCYPDLQPSNRWVDGIAGVPQQILEWINIDSDLPLCIECHTEVVIHTPQIEFCECMSPHCPVCEGNCREKAVKTAYRIDGKDTIGVEFCQGCLQDATQFRQFTTEKPVTRHLLDVMEEFGEP